MLATGKLNERAALAEIGSGRNLTRWQAYARLYPFNAEAEDWRFALLFARLFNRMAWSAETPTVHPADLMPDRDGRIAEDRRRRDAQAGEQQLSPEEWQEQQRLERDGPDREEG